MNTEKDTIFSTNQIPVSGFQFDEKVAAVFPDMIKRSVPGYSHIISTIGILAERYSQPNTNIYDLGCSLGAATLAIRHRVSLPGVKIFAVDNSKEMLKKCELNLTIEDSPIAVEPICADINNLIIHNCSFAVLNFTLQFVGLEQRDRIIKNIYDGMVPGGVLILSEKLAFSDTSADYLLGNLHMDFKRANGYSDLEISQKRQALENILIPETADSHLNRLNASGFMHAGQWFQSFNFASFIAIK